MHRTNASYLLQRLLRTNTVEVTNTLQQPEEAVCSINCPKNDAHTAHFGTLKKGTIMCCGVGTKGGSSISTIADLNINAFWLLSKRCLRERWWSRRILSRCLYVPLPSRPGRKYRASTPRPWTLKDGQPRGCQLLNASPVAELDNCCCTFLCVQVNVLHSFGRIAVPRPNSKRHRTSLNDTSPPETTSEILVQAQLHTDWIIRWGKGDAVAHH